LRTTRTADSAPQLDGPSPLEIGQPFNPYKLFTGIFVPDALVRTSRISAGAKLAYGRLSRYAGADGDCYPSVKVLARELGLKERQAQRHLSELQAGGLIRSFPRFKAPNVRDTNGYVFLWHQIFASSTRPSVPDPAPPLVSRTTLPLVSDLTPPPVSRTTSPPVSDVSPKENQTKESHLEENPSSSAVEDQTPSPTPSRTRTPDQSAISKVTDDDGHTVVLPKRHYKGDLDAVPTADLRAHAEHIRRVFAGTGRGIPTDQQIGAAIDHLPIDTTPQEFATFVRRKIPNIRHAGAIERLAQEYAHEVHYGTPSAVFKCSKCHDQGFVLPGGQYCDCRIGARRRKVDERAHGLRSGG